MDEQNVTTNVEVDNSQVTATPAVDNTATNIEVDNSQVITNATPMDSNTTYDNLANQIEPEPSVPEPQIDYNKDPLQNVVQNNIAIDEENALQANAGQALNNFLTNEYDYDKNEAGTYWVAGAINDVDTQMSFLNTLINEDMYDEMDLQKFYYDNTMATARAYAAQKQKETAYGFYRAAQEKAIAEASLTGWYMPAEGNYMLGQYTVAQNKLEDPDATPEDKAKANRVIGVTEKWFNANQIGTRGIKCLSMMQYEETVRHNEIMGRLNQQAQAIQAAGQAASNELAWAELRFRVEEMELQSGTNYSKQIGLDNKEWIGHEKGSQFQMLDGAANVQEILKNPYYYSAILGYRGSDWMQEVLGDDYNNYHDNYNAYTNKSLLNSENFTSVDQLEGETLKLENKELADGTVTDGTVKIVALRNDEGKMEKRVFAKLPDGSWKQLDWLTVSGDNGALNHTYTEAEMASHTDKTKTQHIGGLDLKNGKRLGDYIKQDEFIPESKVENGVRIYDKVYNKDGSRIYLSKFTGNSGAGDATGWNATVRSQAVVDAVNKKSKEGYVVKEGYYADDKGAFNGQKQGIIMYNPETDDYISISVTTNGFDLWQGEGAINKIDKKNLKTIPDKPFNELSSSQQHSVMAQMEYVGTIQDGRSTHKSGSVYREEVDENGNKRIASSGKTDEIIFAYKDGTGKTHYVSAEDEWGNVRNGRGEVDDRMQTNYFESVDESYVKEHIGEESLDRYEKRKEEYEKNSSNKSNIKSKASSNKDTDKTEDTNKSNNKSDKTRLEELEDEQKNSKVTSDNYSTPDSVDNNSEERNYSTYNIEKNNVTMGDRPDILSQPHPYYFENKPGATGGINNFPTSPASKDKLPTKKQTKNQSSAKR